MDIDEIGGEGVYVDGGVAADMEEESKAPAEAMDIDEIGQSDNIFEGSKYFVVEEPEDTVKKVRTYDLSITYDFYYQTPRLWLMGYSEDGQILKEQEVFEDVMGEYA